MRGWSRLIPAVACAAMLLGQGPARAADTEDWPCIQQKVPEVMPAAVWAGPQIDQIDESWEEDPAVAPVVRTLAARRTSMDEAKKEIADLAETSDAPNEALTMLFAGLLEELNAERSEVIAGIERYARNQKQLAEKVREDQARLDALRDDPDAAPSEVAELNDQLAWETRIFEERQNSLSFVCEVPRNIEQRIFSLARHIQSELR